MTRLIDKIPISCKLYGMTLKVIQCPTLLNDRNVFGQARYDDMEIVLQPSTESIPIPREVLTKTYYHELVHHIFMLADDDSIDPPLHKREHLIERVTGFLHQALTTAVYKE